MRPDELPGVSKRKRLQITEADLDAVPAAAPSARPPVPPAPPLPTAATRIVTTKQAPPSPVTGAYCSGCGTPLHERAAICPRCGVPTAHASQTADTAVALAIRSKSALAAVLLSLLLTGAGQWYAGRIGRGFAFLAAGIVSGLLIFVLIGLLLLPIVWVWAAIDASNCVREYNTRLAADIGAAPTHRAPNG